MSCLSGVLTFFCGSTAHSSVDGSKVATEKTLSGRFSKLPDRVLGQILLYCNGKELGIVPLACRRFRQLTRNEQGQNNVIWRQILQLQASLKLPNNNKFNYKDLYCLFVVKCYAPGKTALKPEEASFHKEPTGRCVGWHCVERERALVKFVLNSSETSPKETLETIMVFQKAFPSSLRTSWNVNGDPQVLCDSCEKNVELSHSSNWIKPNLVRCATYAPTYGMGFTA